MGDGERGFCTMMRLICGYITLSPKYKKWRTALRIVCGQSQRYCTIKWNIIGITSLGILIGNFSMLRWRGSFRNQILKNWNPEIIPARHNFTHLNNKKKQFNFSLYFPSKIYRDNIQMWSSRVGIGANVLFSVFLNFFSCLSVPVGPHKSNQKVKHKSINWLWNDPDIWVGCVKLHPDFFFFKCDTQIAQR